MKYIFWTCDVEIGELAKDEDGAFDTFVLGKIGGETVGVPLLRSIAREYGTKISWFIDVYPPKYEKNIADLCYKLKSDGESIGLHTHPDTRFDKRRFIYEYSLSEQERIIDFGQRFFYETTGNEVKFHRAGGYGANRNTLIACQKSGLSFDSSFYHQAISCQLSGLPLNVPGENNGIIEIPVTVFEKSLSHKKKTVFQKLDFRYGAKPADIIKIIRDMPDESYIVLFLHSFNFLHLVYNYRKKVFLPISVDKKLIGDFHFLLSTLKENSRCCFRTFDELNFEELKGKVFSPVCCHLTAQFSLNDWYTNLKNKFVKFALNQVTV